MKARFNKFLTLLAVLLFGFGQVWADTELCSATLNGISSNSNTTGIAQTGCTMKWNSVTYSGSDVITIGTVNFYKFSGSSSYVQLVLTSGSFQAGDELTVTLCSNAGSGKTKSVQYSLHSDSGNKSEAQNVGSASPTDVAYTLVAADIESDGSIKIFRGGNTNIRFGSFSVTRAGGGGGDPVDPVFTYTASTYTIGDPALDLSTKLSSTNTVGAITFAVSTSDAGTTGASIASDKNFTATTAGTATITVSQEASTGYNAHSEDITVTVVEPDPCHKYFYFTKAADATTAGVTNNEGGFFTVSASGSNGTTGSITLDGTTYNCTNRTSNATTLATFTIPANKKGDLYGLLMSSGSSARGLLLDGVSTGVSCEGGTSELHNIEINNIVPGTHTLTADGNTRVGMFIMKVCDATFRTITLEYADGTTPDGSLSVLDGEAATKPADPTWAHHRFAGWYNGASPYDWASTVSGDITLTAHWTQLYTITYAAGDGTATGDAPTQEDKAEGETFSVAANPFTVAGKDFVTWNDGANDYAPSATYTVGTDNVILTAQWKAAADKYTVVFKDGETTLDTKLVEVGSNPSDAGVDKTKPLYTFAAWQKDDADIALDDAFWATVVKDATVTLTARWTKAFATNIDFEAFIDAQTTSGNWGAELAAKNYAISSTTGVTLDAPTGKPADKGLKIKNSGAYVSFNVNAGKLVLLKAGVLSGAEASVDGGANYTALTGASGSTGASVVTPLYNANEAEYRIRTTTGSYNIIQSITIQDPFTVTFEAHGDADPSPLNGTPSVTLPNATNGTESLLGWFTEATGGTKIGDAGDIYTPTANITLHAQWEAVSTDARLASITFSAVGTLSPAFDPEVVNYTYTMPYGTADVPQITGATSVNANAQAPVIDAQASAWGETAVIRGVAESGDSKAYNITMKLAPKDGICLVWADIPSANTLTYNASKSLLAEEAVTLAISDISGKDPEAPSGIKFQKKGYIKIAMNEGTFQEGDVVALDVTYGASSTMHVFKVQTPSSDADVIGTGDGATTPAGVNKVAITEDATTLYLARPNDGIYNGWNPHVDYVAVYRAMNPILKSVTVNGVNAAPVGTTVTLEVPSSTTQTQLEEIAFDWVSNSDAWTADPANAPVAANAWEFGVANTVTLTDKDGDASVYIVTVNKAAASANVELATLTVNGNAVTVVPGQAEYNYELPYGTSAAPTVAATAEDANATVGTITQAASATGSATFTVTAENGTTTRDYTINFSVCPWEEVVIWDGSNMTEVATSPGAHGLTWEVTGFGSITNYNATCGTKAYTKTLPSGGSASGTRNVAFTVPTDYVAKFYIVFGTHSDGDSRGMFIASNAVSKLEDATDVALTLYSDSRDNLTDGTSEVVGAGTYYLDPMKSVDFYEIRAYLRPGYGRTAMLGNGVLGTVCVPNNVAAEDIQGATFYELMGRNAEGKLAFDEIVSAPLEAGKPYLFQAHGDRLVLFYGATHKDDPVNPGNGMYGTFTDITLTELADVYYFAQKALWGCSDLTSLSVPANRAYVKLSEVTSLSSLSPAPGRRRIELNVNGENAAQGFENLQSGDAPMKVMIDGTLYILRGEKVYNANGQLVK